MLLGIIAIPKVSFAYDSNNTVSISTDNTATIQTSSANVSTNAANSTVGDVSIITNRNNSAIYSANGFTSVSTAFANSSSRQQKPMSPSTPSQPTSGNVPSTEISSPLSSSSGFDGSSGGATFAGVGSSIGIATAMLPFTGSNWFFIAFIGNILMLLMGRYLRLHSGRSPGFAYAL